MLIKDLVENHSVKFIFVKQRSDEDSFRDYYKAMYGDLFAKDVTYKQAELRIGRGAGKTLTATAPSSRQVLMQSMSTTTSGLEPAFSKYYRRGKKYES